MNNNDNIIIIRMMKCTIDKIRVPDKLCRRRCLLISKLRRLLSFFATFLKVSSAPSGSRVTYIVRRVWHDERNKGTRVARVCAMHVRFARERGREGG